MEEGDGRESDHVGPPRSSVVQEVGTILTPVPGRVAHYASHVGGDMGLVPWASDDKRGSLRACNVFEGMDEVTDGTQSSLCFFLSKKKPSSAIVSNPDYQIDLMLRNPAHLYHSFLSLFHHRRGFPLSFWMKTSMRSHVAPA